MKQFAKAIALFSAGSFVGTLTQIAKGKLGALVLGADGVGVINQLTNTWNLLYSISGLGFYNGIVRRVAHAHTAEDRNAMLRQLSTSLIFLTTFACALTALSLLVSPMISRWVFVDSGEHAGLVMLTLASVPFAITAQTYRGLLSGCQLIKPIVSAQVVSDVLGLVAFVILVLSFNLVGAAIAFGTLQVLKLALQMFYVRKALSESYLVPKPAYFDWREVRTNIGYGINGLFMVSVGVFTVVLVSRWIIAAAGLGANGLFSVAWKVASVYFGAIYASASSHYFPSLVACKDDDDLGARINEAITLYFYLLPPIIIALMLAGETLMTVLFSTKFASAAVLLLFLLPGDLFRVLAEAMGMAFLARRRLLPYSLTYVLWAGVFLALTWLAIPRFGVVGAAYAYLAAQVVSAIAVYVCARRIFSFHFSWTALRAIIAGTTAAGATAALLMRSPSTLSRYTSGALILALWLATAMTETQFRQLALATWEKLRLTRQRSVL
ncbi:MAG: oligosaccharide flippase family protein [Tahibacter sp.]